MRLPPVKERFAFYADLVNKCNHSRDARKRQYTLWKSYFLYGGGPNMTENTINKIYSHVEQLCSLMYSSETTRFSIDLSPSASDLFKAQVPALMHALNEEWHSSNVDNVFNMALLWSFVYGSTFIKTRVSGTEIETHMVSPHDFGVLREDTNQLWRQEAFCHSYFITKSQFVYEMREIEHPRLEQILKTAIAVPRTVAEESTQGLDRIVTSASNPLVTGNVNFDLSSPNKYKPVVPEEMLQMYELYVFDDEEKDFRVVTIADPGVVVFDRPIKEMFIKGEIPFVQICPSPAPDYFWGYSETDKLIPLQKMRNTRMDQVMHMLNLQTMPPKYASGFDGAQDEMALAMDSPNGLVVSGMPGAKFEAMVPKVPEDVYKEIREIDAMFEDMSGITNVISGKGESGVRSQGHAANLARLGSSRAKRRALMVEDSLEKLATLYLQLKQAYDPSRLQDTNGLQFVTEQFSKDFTVKVDAHSNSPIFTEDTKQLAFELFKAKAIDRESLLELLDVPMKELLKDKLKVIEAKEAEQAKAQQAAEAQKAQSKSK